MIKQARSLIWKDLLVEFRSRQFIGAMLAFTLVTIVTLNFAFDLSQTSDSTLAAGALWIAFLFSAVLGLGRSIASERDRGTYDGLLVLPVDGGVLFLGKFLSSLVSILFIEAVSIPVFAVLYDLPAFHPAAIAVFVVGTAGIASLGTLFSAVASAGKAREVLLPLLLFPILVPILIGSVRATAAVFDGDFGDVWKWFNLLVGFDVIFIALSYVGFGYIVED